MKNSLINLKSILCIIRNSKEVMTYDVKMASKRYNVYSKSASKNMNQNEKLPKSAPVLLNRKRDKRIVK